MKSILYAVGDVHGRVDLLDQLHGHICDHHERQHANRPGEIIYLGDYIDRGPDSIGVIDRLMSGMDGFQTTCLMGNHEAMLLECLATDNRRAWDTWLSNGGDDTIASLGISLRFGRHDPQELSTALGRERISWLRALPFYRLVAPYLFVHAGIVPGVPLEQQHPWDLLWIRWKFLASDADHGYVVVHGHTPGDEPVVRHNRICVDTGAAYNGVLTAAVLDGESRPMFLRAVGGPGRTG